MKIVAEGSDVVDKKLLIKIASAYYFKSDFDNASKWFEK